MVLDSYPYFFHKAQKFNLEHFSFEMKPQILVPVQ